MNAESHHAMVVALSWLFTIGAYLGNKTANEPVLGGSVVVAISVTLSFLILRLTE